MQNIEQEFKWDASVRGAFERFVQAAKIHCTSVRAVAAVHITDYYLDNERRDFSACKTALRIRHIGARWQATLKTRNRLQNGLAVRGEWTINLAGARCFKQALALLEKRQEWQGVCVRNLQEKFRICNKRRCYKCKYKNVHCEIALDNYVTRALAHQWRRREIELELKKGSVKMFTKLIEKLSQSSQLQAAKISKVAGAEKWISEKLGKTNF